MAKDRYRFFRIEAKELLDTLTQAGRALDGADDPQEVAQRLMRAAHTLKGAAGVVELAELSNNAHELEDLLAGVARGTAALTPEHLEALPRALDAISDGIANLPAPAESVADEPAPPVRTAQPTPPAKPARPVQPAQSVQLAQSVQPGKPAKPAAPRRAAVPPTPSVAFDLETVRVSVDTLDALVRSASSVRTQVRAMRRELSDAQLGHSTRGESATNGSTDASSTARAVRANAARADAALETLWQELHEIRLLPARVLAERLQAAAEQAARQLDKRIRFSTEGAECRVDARAINSLYPGLLHVVRNAVDHGIEAAAERAAAGKPEDGTIVLSFSPIAGGIRVACTDDGAGVDVAAVSRAGLDGGVLSDDEASALDMGGAVELIRGAGFTTHREVTAVSGRGVGMDVLSQAAAHLGADLRIESRAGAGTTVALSVPRSIASMAAIAVRVNGNTLWIPFASVRQVVSHEGAFVESPLGPSLLWAGETVPLLPLGVVSPSLVYRRIASEACLILVLGTREAPVGLLVDAIGSVEDIVVQPLPALTRTHGAILGAVFDPEGDPQLVLNPSVLPRKRGAFSDSAEGQKQRVTTVLVIDDSITTQMVEKSILEKAGYRVDLASSGEEALQMARLRPYDLFLCDVEMPGIDGFEFVETSRRDESLRDIPAVLVTTRDSDEDRRRGMSSGASGYLIKTELDEHKLLTLVRRLTA